jgi:hypothetical protein
MGLQLIGAGFGRTGTKSIQAALHRLGLAPCHHMSEVFEHPEQAPVWEAACRGEAVDFNALLADYQATVDWPACLFYRELLALHPQAKVLLSLRDPDNWYDSVHQTIYTVNQALSPRTRTLAAMLPKGAVLQMIDALMWQTIFQGRFTDRAFAIERFERHNAEVQASVPPDRLLVYRVQQGWEPLCAFLGVAVPDEPFPRVNDAAEFQAKRGVAGRLK